MNNLTKIGRFYRRLLCRHPILVQSVQTGLLMATGDVIAQKLIEKKCKLELLRTAQFFGLGTVGVGPALTIWYRCLSKLIKDCSKYAGLKKMAVDQLLFAPFFLVVFVVALNVLQGKDFEHVKTELCAKYTDILLSNYKVWPLVQVINFSLVPLAYQVLVVQIVAINWNAYLSWKTQQEIKEE